ncbi:hypothetical protein L248_0316 [Schleiferilactobacillus shenzhenensis LY-73]|uniref:Type II toxin-antitoxin system RelE/ParE family toxin n=2 Tax=Schleiferilactobacillus shenzhenensis TaxID=1231337 RepID=U4TZ98_9LACO|nr:hypothetical protein L248_0316 [Schleiferilactobacillus shenzhenensis LY-73]
MGAIKFTEDKGLLIAAQMLVISKLTPDIYELRSRLGKNWQRALYFHVVGNDFVITHGFSKKKNKTPLLEIRHAEELRDEFYETISRK